MNKRIVAVVIVLALAAAGWWLYRHFEADEEAGALKISGTVEATDARLGFQAAGRITELAVDEGDEVASGDVLARLDADELEARRAQAAASVEAAEAALRELQRGSRPQEIAQARDAVAAAEEEVEQARRDHTRTATLHQGGAVSQEALDRASTALELAERRLAQARERLGLVREGPRKETVEAQAARVGEARAALRSVDSLLDDMALTAPFDGRVTTKHRTLGETVSPGAPVVTLQDLSDRWVRVYVPEDRLGEVQLGEPARISSDTFPGEHYDGEVSFLSSEAEFTPKSVQTPEERVRLVYAAKVRITGDPDHVLKPGMPVDVELAPPKAEGGE